MSGGRAEMVDGRGRCGRCSNIVNERPRIVVDGSPALNHTDTTTQSPFQTLQIPSPPPRPPTFEHAEMTDPPRGESVFGGLEAFDDNPDADAMDRMLLNLAASTDPPDWQLDSLPNDLYVNSSQYPPLPLQYIDTEPEQDPSPPSPPKQPKRVPTTVCPLCGKAISNNGANFRRHEAACRRARLDKTPLDPGIQHSAPAQSHSQQQTPEQTPLPTTPPVSAPSTWSRRDSDLLNVVRRLEQNINTLDVSARVCLRDALLSLSNKAANPTVTPTPQQEAMNRAAEYLVLRMLFLSGQQVMHTPPGTAPPPYAEPPSTTRTSEQHNDDDGTVAASTGTGGPTVSQEHAVRQTLKDDKLPDQT